MIRKEWTVTTSVADALSTAVRVKLWDAREAESVADAESVERTPVTARSDAGAESVANSDVRTIRVAVSLAAAASAAVRVKAWVPRVAESVACAVSADASPRTALSVADAASVAVQCRTTFVATDSVVGAESLAVRTGGPNNVATPASANSIQGTSVVVVSPAVRSVPVPP
jgi:hypothetical protein